MSLPTNPNPNQIVKSIKDLENNKLDTSLGISNKLLVTDQDGDVALMDMPNIVTPNNILEGDNISIVRSGNNVTISSTSGSEESTYASLPDKPSINNVTLSGNKTLNDLGIQESLVAGSNITINGNTISSDKITESEISAMGFTKNTGTYSKPSGGIPNSDLANGSNYAVKNANNNFTSAQTINGNLTVNGDITQSGSSYETHAEKIYTKNDYIILRENATGGLPSGSYTGFEAVKYDGTNNGRLAFDSTGTARVGDIGSEQPLLTRNEASSMTNNKFIKWNATNSKAVTSDIAISDVTNLQTTLQGYTKGAFTIVTLTQAQYNALSTKDNSTIYLING